MQFSGESKSSDNNDSSYSSSPIPLSLPPSVKTVLAIETLMALSTDHAGRNALLLCECFEDDRPPSVPIEALSSSL